MSRLFLLLPVLLAVAGCDTTDAVCDAADCPDPGTVTVYVGSQGVFSDNSGTVTAYDLTSGEARQDVAPDLGGLVQRLYVEASGLGVDQVLALLNYSDSFSTGRGRIVRIGGGAAQTVVDVGTPRDLVEIDATTAYVSDLYGAAVTPVDLIDGTAGTPIPVGDNPEGITVVGDRVYVANSGFGFGKTVSVLDAATGEGIETLEDVCFGPRTLQRDGDGEVWVLCTGFSDFETGEVIEDGAVVVLDGATGAEVARIEVEGVLGAASLGQDAAYSGTRQALFAVLGQEILRFDTATNTLASRFPVEGAPVSAVAYHDPDDRLYLGRPDPDNPFSAAGFVSIHDADGSEIDRFGAGVVPGSIVFVTSGIEG